MKEIKFRVWDKEEQKMYFDALPFIVITNHGAFKLDPTIEKNRYFKVDKELVLMQYTGLKDKDGTEIYAGDILRKKCGFGNELFSFCKVVFEKGCFGFYWLDVEHSDDEGFKTFWSSEDNEFHWNPSDFEVVGNVYEQPELLE